MNKERLNEKQGGIDLHDLKVAFRKNTDVLIEFVDFLRWTAQILHQFHLTGAFESES